MRSDNDLQALQAIEKEGNNDRRITRQTNPVAYAPNSLGSDVSKERYTEKIAAFFDFIGLEGNSLEEKGLEFLAKAKEEVKANNNPYWIEDNIQDFLTHHKERLKKGDCCKHSREVLLAYQSLL